LVSIGFAYCLFISSARRAASRHGAGDELDDVAAVTACKLTVALIICGFAYCFFISFSVVRIEFNLSLPPRQTSQR
jgi:hypothetical protein